MEVGAGANTGGRMGSCSLCPFLSGEGGARNALHKELCSSLLPI